MAQRNSVTRSLANGAGAAGLAAAVAAVFVAGLFGCSWAGTGRPESPFPTLDKFFRTATHLPATAFAAVWIGGAFALAALATHHNLRRPIRA